MTVAQKLRRNMKITTTTRAMVSSSVNCTSSTDGADGLRAVAQDADLDRRRHRGAQLRQLRLDAVDGLDDVGAGLLEDDEEHAALAVRPGRLLGVLRAGHRLADVADAQRRAVAIGDDDVVPVLRRGQLVVGVDGVAARLAVDAALGRVDGRDARAGVRTSSSDMPLATSLAGSSWMRMAGFCSPPTMTCADAGDLADLLGELGVGVVVDLGQRQGVGRHRQQQDRRVGRVDLAVGRRRSAGSSAAGRWRR